MKIETIEYKNKNLEYFTKPNGDAAFITKSFFEVLGQPIPLNLIGMELVQLDYDVALVYAQQHDEEFAQFLYDNFNEGHIAATMVEGK